MASGEVETHVSDDGEYPFILHKASSRNESRKRCWDDGRLCGSNRTRAMTIFIYLSSIIVFITVSYLVLLTCFNLLREENDVLIPLTEGQDRNELCINALPMFHECGHPPTNRWVFQTRKKRVIGGDIVKNPDYYPWMAKLLYKHPSKSDGKIFRCGATVISSRYLLTSAHCVICEDPMVARLRVNHFSEISVEKVIIHEGYKRQCKWEVPEENQTNINREHDIALIRLKEEIPNVQPICLPLIRCYNLEHQKLINRSEKAFVAGYGRYRINDTSGHSPDELRQVSLPRISKRQCELHYPGDNSSNFQEITGTMMCAGQVEGKDFCNGDSGGPFFMSYESRSIQIGVAAFGKEICGIGSASVFTSIIPHMQWIKDSMEH